MTVIVAHDTSTQWRAATPPRLAGRDVHVHRVAVDRPWSDADWAVLADDERERAGRFHFERDSRSFVHSHASLRRALAAQLGASPSSLRFTAGEFGKPALVDAPELHFNLSHSGALALFALAHGPVGIDVEQWKEDIEHVDLADHFFSPAERAALRTAHAAGEAVDGFFAAWSRKEAYLKASGHGITRGLHHFDVSLLPGEAAALLADGLDAGATERWVMRAIHAGDGYSAALVAEAPVDEVRFFEASAR